MGGWVCADEITRVILPPPKINVLRNRIFRDFKALGGEIRTQRVETNRNTYFFLFDLNGNFLYFLNFSMLWEIDFKSVRSSVVISFFRILS